MPRVPAVAKADNASIIWKDKTPIWNLTEVTAYPVELNRKTVYVYLSPYTAEELKAVLRKANSGYKREKRDVEIFREDRSIYVPLVDAHFIRLGNATGTPDEQRTFLDKYAELKPGIVEFSFGGVQLDTPLDDGERTELLDISTELSGSVKVFQNIYDPVTDKVVRVDMTHNHAHPSEGQYRQYRGARRSKFSSRTSLWTISEQYGTLEMLYDAIIRSVDGAAVNGKLCEPAAKDEWLPDIPLWHKLWIVDQIFGELVEKNA